MVTAPNWRHVPAGRLALLAQRLGRVFASASTWHRLIRERGWRRPRLRLHPIAPREGIRAEAPDGLWHIDTTVVRLLDGTKAFVQAVLDNFSRRILAWRVTDRLQAGTSEELLVEAAAHLPEDAAATVLADQGVENCNRDVDALIERGILRRVLAQVDISFSNSLIEAWWRSLKHGWLFLHPLESVAQVRRLVGFYVEQHNEHIPHAAFRGQTPDEMYFGTGAQVPDRLAERRARAREERLAANRSQRCVACA
jgi:transposase InsO family protein